MLMSEMVQRGVQQFADRTAIRFGDEALTFAEAHRWCNRIANALIATGHAPTGARIALLLNNGLFSIPLDFACAAARLTRVPLNARLSAREHAQMITGAGAQVLVYGPDLGDRAADLAALLPGLALLCLGEDSRAANLLALAESADATGVDRIVEAKDVVLALYTSGTTGSLKAACHTQRSWAAVATNILGNLVEVRPGEMMLHAASLIHASGTMVLPYWVRGGIAGVLPNFVPEDYCAAVERWRPAAVNLVPTMIGMLLDLPGIAARDFGSIDTIVYGASPMPRATLRRGLDLWGPRFTQYYGQSEAPLCISVLTKSDHEGPDADRRLLSCGRVSLDCEIKLISEDGERVAPGEPGEILVRAPFAMIGYHDAAALNAETITPDGWIHSRDIGQIDADGYLYLVDRTSDMIVSGGYNVYPREVEDVLMSHPSVREAVVVGLPDDKWGEVVTAFVAVREGMQAEPGELMDFARAQLAGYKVPKDVRFIAEVPKSAVGKLLRRAVRDPFWAGRERKL
ncbi:long-chain fatty acid--CoA ligase [Sphingomonas sp. Leaf357]|uniref:class I adenylate-forming enzyme family protein n=1 Tax=Sphingomonas sp. Leaf357 TaxID=1736350 RepID=UPI0006F29059|nr:AMP-binding protein [Sphingomonas sp. Leaf357]KQS03603.1 long-chain fatty acid--CoA ligase [Sphingomonas sp. Leaf357]